LACPLLSREHTLTRGYMTKGEYNELYPNWIFVDAYMYMEDRGGKTADTCTKTSELVAEHFTGEWFWMYTMHDGLWFRFYPWGGVSPP